ncbi:phage tail family protein [Bacillus sp. ISL-18]|uniref:phage distal tail protein n=1 Tax=Bacillus sp. ISL-18 TaxID=2819118 RepID=UPI001BE638E4|nr:phage tail domain-containing protein [Bacillus sp. ISL-18]MBT2656613.1 phage tail family protein [Bacillus sp. ISL-18]
MADKLYWIDANGTEQPLSDNNFKVLSGMTGRFMPPVSIVEEEVPFQAGTRKRHVKVSPRDVDIPLFLQADSEIELRQLMRRILKMINPFKEGKLKSIAVDGSQRELYCQYISGMEGSEGRDNKGFWWQNAVLVFHAFDPYWYDTNTIVETFSIGQTATFFPFFPLRLSSSSVFADFSIDNIGDIECHPEWIIQGPGDNIFLRNLTTGELTNLETSLGVGEIITIDTKPKKKSITKGDGTNLFGTQTDDNSSLWTLQSGVNNIRIEMSNATSESSVQLSYTPRYWCV